MSLTVYLQAGAVSTVPCEHCGGTGRMAADTVLHEANITHNLIGMAYRAGIYEAVWHPDEIGAVRARDIVRVLTAGLAKLEAGGAEAFQDTAPENGWGTFDGLVKFVREYLEACKANPDALILVSR